MLSDRITHGFYMGSTIGSIVGYIKNNEGQYSNRFINVAVGTILGGCAGAILAQNKTALTVVLLLTTGELFCNYCNYDFGIISTALERVNQYEQYNSSLNKRRYHGGYHSSVYN
jgi:hypothetical protein